jgi:ATPase family associated with various cellular activities (AAA)
MTIDDLPRTPENHFRLQIFEAVLMLSRRLPEPTGDNGLEFLRGYLDQIPRDDRAFAERLAEWERGARLPMCTLGLGPLEMTLLFTAGLVDEDARFGSLFEAMNGIAEPRPTLGLLATWSEDDAARDALHGLLDAGLIRASNPDAPRARWALDVPPVLWDAMRGRSPGGQAGAVRHHRVDELPRLDDLLLPDDVRDAAARAAALLPSRPVLIRGPRSSGRHTLAAAIAREAGHGVLELIDGAAHAVGPLSLLLDAVPLTVIDSAPGETAELPALTPLLAVAGPRGGVRAEGVVTIRIGSPERLLRSAHWAAGLGDEQLAAELGPRLRTTSGTIRRAASLARGEALLAGRTQPIERDVRSALRSLEAEALETLATRIPVAGDWSDLAVGDETARELDLLQSRALHREQLNDVVGPAVQLSPGLRALFSGPSGTGKTLAARLLAAALGKELYALDLSTVVNKYLGETEKNLDAVFSRAEELDVILMLDEGDALMTRRTDVNTSNDRYANLETNFLLQRLEAYEGILLVTTNAGDRIDPAFRRRLDVVVEFRAPEAGERAAIWQLHLPPNHAVGDAYLDEVAARCQLTGGQIRNAALHAALLALDDVLPLGASHVEEAVQREYRKAGTVCPLRPLVTSGG